MVTPSPAVLLSFTTISVLLLAQAVTLHKGAVRKFHIGPKQRPPGTGELLTCKSPYFFVLITDHRAPIAFGNVFTNSTSSFSAGRNARVL